MVCCLCRRCINSTVFIHLLDRLIFHCKCAACVIGAWSLTGIVKQEYSRRRFVYWWSQTFSYLFTSGKKYRKNEWGEALSELKGFFSGRSLHASGGGHRFLCVWISDSACSTTGRVHYWEQSVLCSEVTLLFWAPTTDEMHFCPPPPPLDLPPTSPVAPVIPPAFSPLTLRSFPLSWWVSQLTIWPTKDPKRLSSTTVQAMTGWENEREWKRQREGMYSIHHPPW